MFPLIPNALIDELNIGDYDNFRDWLKQNNHDELIFDRDSIKRFNLFELGQAIKMSNIRVVNLSDCDLDSSDILLFVKGLRKGTQALELNLSRNKIGNSGDLGWKSIALSLRNTQVQSIDISKNSIKTTPLFEEVKSSNIKKMKISINPFSFKMQRLMNFLFKSATPILINHAISLVFFFLYDRALLGRWSYVFIGVWNKIRSSESLRAKLPFEAFKIVIAIIGTKKAVHFFGRVFRNLQIREAALVFLAIDKTFDLILSGSWFVDIRKLSMFENHSFIDFIISKVCDFIGFPTAHKYSESLLGTPVEKIEVVSEYPFFDESVRSLFADILPEVIESNKQLSNVRRTVLPYYLAQIPKASPELAATMPPLKDSSTIEEEIHFAMGIFNQLPINLQAEVLRSVEPSMMEGDGKIGPSYEYLGRADRNSFALSDKVNLYDFDQEENEYAEVDDIQGRPYCAIM